MIPVTDNPRRSVVVGKQGTLPIAVEVEAAALDSLNFRELKCLAKLLKIPGYSGLRRADMLEVVEDCPGVLPSHIEAAKAAALGWKKHGVNRKN